jgi:hypothetical protein
MLNKRVANFAELVWTTAGKVGNSAPAIADKIIKRAFPQTVAEAEIEGADKMLRVGVINAIKTILKHAAAADEQIDFSSIEPKFGRIVKKLKSNAYFVESAGEYVSISRLIEEPDLLDDARRHMRRKGMECLADAKVLDELYAAITE